MGRLPAGYRVRIRYFAEKLLQVARVYDSLAISWFWTYTIDFTSTPQPFVDEFGRRSRQFVACVNFYDRARTEDGAPIFAPILDPERFPLGLAVNGCVAGIPSVTGRAPGRRLGGTGQHFEGLVDILALRRAVFDRHFHGVGRGENTLLVDKNRPVIIPQRTAGGLARPLMARFLQDSDYNQDKPKPHDQTITDPKFNSYTFASVARVAAAPTDAAAEGLPLVSYAPIEAPTGVDMPLLSQCLAGMRNGDVPTFLSTSKFGAPGSETFGLGAEHRPPKRGGQKVFWMDLTQPKDAFRQAAMNRPEFFPGEALAVNDRYLFQYQSRVTDEALPNNAIVFARPEKVGRGMLLSSGPARVLVGPHPDLPQRPVAADWDVTLDEIIIDPGSIGCNQ